MRAVRFLGRTDAGIVVLLLGKPGRRIAATDRGASYDGLYPGAAERFVTAVAGQHRERIGTIPCPGEERSGRRTQAPCLRGLETPHEGPRHRVEVIPHEVVERFSCSRRAVQVETRERVRLLELQVAGE